MYFPLSNPIRGISGKFHKKTYTFVVRNGLTYIRLEPKKLDPKTPAQLAVRSLWGEVKKDWSRVVTARQRNAWDAWARNVLVPRGLASPHGPTGYNAYVKMEQMRRVLAIAPGGDAPKGAPPANIFAVVQKAPAIEGSLAFTVEHGESDAAGKFLLIETTRAMPTPRRKPREWELHWAAGISASSFVPLQPSGARYDFSAGHDVIAAGERFGVRLRIISAEGVPGQAIRTDWIKLTVGMEGQMNAAEGATTHAETTAASAPVGPAHWDSLDAATPPAKTKRLADKRLNAWWDALDNQFGTTWYPPWYRGERKQRKEKKRISESSGSGANSLQNGEAI